MGQIEDDAKVALVSSAYCLRVPKPIYAVVSPPASPVTWRVVGVPTLYIRLTATKQAFTPDTPISQIRGLEVHPVRGLAGT